MMPNIIRFIFLFACFQPTVAWRPHSALQSVARKLGFLIDHDVLSSSARLMRVANTTAITGNAPAVDKKPKAIIKPSTKGDDVYLAEKEKEKEESKDLAELTVTAKPYHIWTKLKLTGRHGWRERFRNGEAGATSTNWGGKTWSSPEHIFNDWCFLLSTLAFAMVLQASLFHVPSTLIMHVAGLTLWVIVGTGYFGVVRYRRETEDGASIDWLTGYILEAINMVENIFIFHSLAKAIGMPRLHTRKTLLGVMICQILFQTFLFMGLFDWLRQVKVLPYILGVWLIYMGYIVARGQEYDDVRLTETWPVQFIQRCLGAYFWPHYDDQGWVFVYKGERRVLSVLGPILLLFAALDFLLEIDVTLTKIEEIPDQYIAYTSSVVATFALPDLFYVAGALFRRFAALKYGIGLITAYFGVQMLLSEYFLIPAAVNCAVMVCVVILCITISFCIDGDGEHEADDPFNADAFGEPSQSSQEQPQEG